VSDPGRNQADPSPETARRAWIGPAEIGVAAFTAAYLGVAVVAAGITGNTEFVFYIAVMLVLIGVVGVVHARVRLSARVLWALAVWGLAHMAGGMVPVAVGEGGAGVLYNLWLVPRWLRYDQLVHAYGFGVSTRVCWECLRGRLAATGDVRPTVGVIALCALAAMGLGAGNEIVEFAATKIASKTNVGDYENNALDLVFNAIGATVVAVVIWWRGRITSSLRGSVAASQSSDA